MAEPVLPSTSGDSFAGMTGSVIAQEMRAGRALLGEHLESCRYCIEFGALCPAAVRLFIQWRGKPPADDYILGGAAWLDGHPQGEEGRLMAEMAPGTAWTLNGETPPSEGLRRGGDGWQLMKAFPSKFSAGKVHYLTGDQTPDGTWPILCSHDTLGTVFEGQHSDVTCKHCRRLVVKRHGRLITGEQLGLDLA